MWPVFALHSTTAIWSAQEETIAGKTLQNRLLVLCCSHFFAYIDSYSGQRNGHCDSNMELHLSKHWKEQEVVGIVLIQIYVVFK